MLPVLLAMIVVVAMTTMYFSYMSVCDTRQMADQIAREYILFMETTGYLNDEAKNDMITELEKLGLSNINLAGTTVSLKEYGNEITLNISAIYEVEQISFQNIFKPVKNKEIYYLNISKKTTAKC